MTISSKSDINVSKMKRTPLAIPGAEEPGPARLPLLDQLRMFCYTNKVEIPSFLAA